MTGDAVRTKSLRGIEERMNALEPGSLRYRVLESAKNFKTSWVDLGRSLYSVYKDKLYKEWGYATFDAYTSKEIGIRKQTAVKLLKSYFFLEKEEPAYLKGEYVESSDAASIPGYESVNVLRLAKEKKELQAQDYQYLKKEVFEKGKDASEARKELTALIRERRELEPEEAWEKRKLSTVKRFLGTLKALRQEVETAKLLPHPLVKEIASLIKKIESEIC